MKKLYTIGYQGMPYTRFLALMSRHEIDTLIDVRANPMSRIRPYNRRILTRSLDRYREIGELKTRYESAKEFGIDTAICQIYKRDVAGLIAYAWRLFHPGKLVGLSKRIKAGERVCLMCFEADPTTCHRSVLAKRLQELIPDLEVVHLGRES